MNDGYFDLEVMLQDDASDPMMFPPQYHRVLDTAQGSFKSGLS